MGRGWARGSRGTAELLTVFMFILWLLYFAYAYCVCCVCCTMLCSRKTRAGAVLAHTWQPVSHELLIFRSAASSVEKRSS